MSSAIRNVALLRRYMFVSQRATALDSCVVHVAEYVDQEKEGWTFIFLMDEKTGLVALKMSLVTRLCSGFITPSTNVILICDSISAQAVLCIQSVCRVFQVLSKSDVCIERMSHAYVPKYSRLTQEEITAIEVVTGPKSTWPKMIMVQDPIARILGCRAGDCLKAISPSQLTGLHVTYRIVVDNR